MCKRIVRFFLLFFILGCLYFPVSAYGEYQNSAAYMSQSQQLESQTDSEETTQDTTQDTTYVRGNNRLILPAYASDWNLTCCNLTVNLPNTSFILYDGPVAPSQIIWHSSNPNVAEVINGRLFVLQEGTAEIRAEYAGIVRRCNVTCNNANQTEDAKSLPILQPPELSENPVDIFDDAVFVGDSITAQLHGYATKTGLLGDAKFLCETSYSVSNGILDIMKLNYAGRKYTFADAVAATGRKHVFIMLGTNDIGIYGINKTIARWEKFVEKIRAKSPDVTIYIQSIPPMWNPSQLRDLNNNVIRRYNQALRKFAKENGCEFIDIAPYMTNGDGGLVLEYSYDKYVHLSTLGLNTWARVLNAHMEMYKEDHYEETIDPAARDDYDHTVSMQHTGSSGNKAYGRRDNRTVRTGKYGTN